jgi:pimeloyl-ACP methyl ester carboxylesterase
MKPVCLLLAGMLNDARVWQPVREALAPLAEVRVADVCADAEIAAMGARAWGLLADVPQTTPLVMAGFSMGGYVAIDMLAQPGRPVQAAALLSTSALPEAPESRAVREKTIAAMQSNFPKVVEGLLQWNTHQAPPAVLETMRQMMHAVGPEVAVRQMRAIMARADHRAALAQLRLPVRVLCGREDRVTPPALAQTLADAIAGAQLHLIEGSGHMLPLEQPAEVLHHLQALITPLIQPWRQP